MSVAGSSARSASRRAVSSAGSTDAPASTSWSSALGPEPSICSTRRRAGSSAVSSVTIATCASVSAKANTASESCSTQRTCSADDVS